MAKIFISYKYGDTNVRKNIIPNTPAGLLLPQKIVRDYVTHLMEKVLTDHINKAEKDDEDLSHLTEEVIQQKLYDRIYDSTVTLVLISKNMRELKHESLQWVPREVAYSLREKTRDDRTSYTNGVVAIILPDEIGSYDYGIKQLCGHTEIQTTNFFNIISSNMFNRINPNTDVCSNCRVTYHHNNDHSYIYPVKWDDFIQNHNLYINHVLDMKDRLNEFRLTKTHD